MDAAPIPLEHDALSRPVLVFQGQSRPIHPDPGEVPDEIVFRNTQKGCNPSDFRFVDLHVARPLATCSAALTDIMAVRLGRHDEV